MAETVTVLLITSDRPDRSSDDEDRCRETTANPEPPERVCVSVMRTLVGREPAGDDIALLALRWQPGRE